MLNPLVDNPLRTRADIQEAVRALFAPLKPCFSHGHARVTIGQTGAHYANRLAELEGFARPLWGLAPLLAGGGTFLDLDLYHMGFANGCDPHHPEYWGKPGDHGQALVEMAPIGLALALAPQYFWEPLPPTTKQELARWLYTINEVKVGENNWLLFRVLANIGLATVDAPYSKEALQAALDLHETFYLLQYPQTDRKNEETSARLRPATTQGSVYPGKPKLSSDFAQGNGWYADGHTMQRDYYNTFAMHLIGLIYARFAAQSDPERAQRYKTWAAEFAHAFQHWFAPDGSALPFGRSLTYRFAQGSLWGALAFADVEALPWGVLKGLFLRHLRWWAQQPIFNNDGTLSIGYAYPNLNMSESYNSPGSPYWAFTFFLPLALPATHPFWQTQEEALPDLPALQVQPHPHMLLCRTTSHVFALSSGQHDMAVRHGEAKYAKFAYSTAFGFSVPGASYDLAAGAYDSMLALSDDGHHFRVREVPLEARVEDDYLYSRWSPWPGAVEIETWLLPRLPWHIRIHRLRTTINLYSAEGGFALDRTEPPQPSPRYSSQEGDHLALARYPAGWSGIRNLQGQRQGKVVVAAPNTNLLHPRTVIPTLLGEHQPGEYWLVSAVIGETNLATCDTLWNNPPAIGPVEQQILARHG